MRRTPRGRAISSTLLLFVLLMVIQGRAWAVIKETYPLGSMIADSRNVVHGTISRLDKERLRCVIDVRADLKGKLGFRRFNVNLGVTNRPQSRAKDGSRGSAKVERDDLGPAALLPRLEENLPVVLLLQRQDKGYVVLGFTDGTWFSLSIRTRPKRQADGNFAPAVCAFRSCEPYLRRAYAGKTQQLLSLLPDVFRGKRKPPPFDGKRKPGLGPKRPLREKAAESAGS